MQDIVRAQSTLLAAFFIIIIFIITIIIIYISTWILQCAMFSLLSLSFCWSMAESFWGLRV